MNKRLKLYDDYLELVIPHKEKEKLRKLAYKNKISISEYVRRLITMELDLQTYVSQTINAANSKNKVIKNIRRMPND